MTQLAQREVTKLKRKKKRDFKWFHYKDNFLMCLVWRKLPKYPCKNVYINDVRKSSADHIVSTIYSLFLISFFALFFLFLLVSLLFFFVNCWLLIFYFFLNEKHFVCKTIFDGFWNLFIFEKIWPLVIIVNSSLRIVFFSVPMIIIIF